MPPKPKRSKSPDSQFLFVNEDASTVTRATKDAELDRTKQSHVQRQNFARKRRLREQSTSAPPQTSSQNSVSPGPAVAGPSTKVSSPPQGGLSHGTDYFDILQSIDVGDPLFQSTCPQSQSQDPLDPRLTALFSDPFTSTAPSLAIPSHQSHTFEISHPYCPGHFFDAPSPSYHVGSPSRRPSNITSPLMPLSRTPNPPVNNQHLLELWAPPLIQHYNTIILPEKFWMDTRKVPLSQIRHASSIHTDNQSNMVEPAHLYSFLASASTQMIVREGRLLLPEISPQDYHRVPTFFKTKAIQALRNKLAVGQMDHRIAVDVHRLYATGIHADNYEMAEPHFQALLSMIEALGGLSTFDDYQLEKMIMLDCTAALKRLGIPRLLATWDPGSLPEDMVDNIESNDQYHTQAGARLQAFCEPLCPILNETFPELAEVLKMSAYLDRIPEYVPQHYKWCSWRTLTILHRLLSMPLHCEMGDRIDGLRIATAYWTAMKRSPAMARRAASKSNHMLKTRLESTDLENLWRPHTDCLLWVVAFGGITASNEDDLVWYVTIAQKAVAEIGVRNLQELEELFFSLLYDPISQRDMLVEFAGRIWPVSSP